MQQGGGGVSTCTNVLVYMPSIRSASAQYTFGKLNLLCDDIWNWFLSLGELSYLICTYNTSTCVELCSTSTSFGGHGFYVWCRDTRLEVNICNKDSIAPREAGDFEHPNIVTRETCGFLGFFGEIRCLWPQ
jgi:hypothetical protein